jgi:dTDP-4-amino-4,6-dideoxygalactose transaminase
MIPPFTSAVPDDEIATALAAFEQILRSGRLVLGPHTEAFEAGVANMAGTRHATAVNSGATALEIIFRVLEVRDRTVLVPTNSNYATAAAAMAAGAKVELYDGGLYPDITDLQRRLRRDLAAVVVVHIGGYLSPDLPTIAAWCTATGVPLIEDAAHAHGAALSGDHAGGFGYAAAFSFFATKTISTGEGGAIVTDDPHLDRVARLYRNQGKNVHERHVVTGGSWRLTELGAALGCIQLDHLHRDLKRRRTIIDRYSAALSNSGLTFPALHGQVSGHKAIAALATGHDRRIFRDKAFSAGVQLGRGVYDKPLHTHPVFSALNVGDSFPLADAFAAAHVCLPLWRTMSDGVVDQVITALAKVLVE